MIITVSDGLARPFENFALEHRDVGQSKTLSQHFFYTTQSYHEIPKEGSQAGQPGCKPVVDEINPRYMLLNGILQYIVKLGTSPTTVD